MDGGCNATNTTHTADQQHVKHSCQSVLITENRRVTHKTCTKSPRITSPVDRSLRARHAFPSLCPCLPANTKGAPQLGTATYR